MSNQPLKGLIVVEVYEIDDQIAQEKMQAYKDFCVAAADKFSVQARKASFSSEDDRDIISDWLDVAKEVES